MARYISLQWNQIVAGPFPDGDLDRQDKAQLIRFVFADTTPPAPTTLFPVAARTCVSPEESRVCKSDGV